jgi:hypothetical protein
VSCVQWALLVGGERFWTHACASLASFSDSGSSAGTDCRLPRATSCPEMTKSQVAAAPLPSLLRAITLGDIAFDRMATEEGLFTFCVLYHDIVAHQANGFFTLLCQSAPTPGAPPQPSGTNPLPAWLDVIPRLVSLPALRWRLCFAEGLPRECAADAEVGRPVPADAAGSSRALAWVRPRAVPHWSWKPAAGQWHLLSPPVV